MEQIERRQISSEKRLEKILVYFNEGHSSSQLSAEGNCSASSKLRTATTSGVCTSQSLGMSAVSGSGKLGMATITGACSSQSMDGVKEENAGGYSASEQNSNTVNVS